MLSKHSLWDFAPRHPTLITKGRFGPYGLYCSDPYLQKILLNKLPKKLFPNGHGVLFGEELTQRWVSKNLLTPGLFGNKKSYTILFGESVPKESQEIFLEKRDWGGCYLIFCFLRHSKFFDNIGRSLFAQGLKVEMPKFWEEEKLLKFLAQELGVSLSNEAVCEFLDLQSGAIPDLVASLNRLILGFPGEKKISAKNVKELLAPKGVDHFKAAKLFGLKKYREFYSLILERAMDFEEQRSLFGFMQTHLLKLADVSYTKKKTRLSKYDREILSHASLWGKQELRFQLRRMGELEIDAKQRDLELSKKIRQYSLGLG